MSALGEYLNLIPSIIKNREKIIEGIVNTVEQYYGSLPEDEQQEIARRRLICASCPFMSENAKENLAIQYKSSRVDEHCIKCGCNIELKTSSLKSNCGLEVYNLQNPDRKIPLKWEAYKQTK